MTIHEVRQLYVQKVSRITANRARWKNLGLLAEERALLAWAIRRDARVVTRQEMRVYWRVALEAADSVRYGDGNGPEFSSVVQSAKRNGLTGDAVYEYVIDSACRTNENVDRWFRL